MSASPVSTVVVPHRHDAGDPRAVVELARAPQDRPWPAAFARTAGGSGTRPRPPDPPRHRTARP